MARPGRGVQGEEAQVLGGRGDHLKQLMRDKLVDHREYIYRRGEDMPEISGWEWGQP